MSRPLGRISLALSGGGTRAAGYHLGALSYLDRLGLLTDVAVISGASGGAFVVSTYAMSQAKGQSFQAYADWMMERLRTGRMAEWVLDEFTGGKPLGLSGRRTIIAALAESYDRHFFEGFRFGAMVDMEPGPGHLEEVVINATDYRTGLGFRFQLHAPAGNAQSPIDPALLRHARLADIMASSSCLPGGMEPFFFPEDFVWDGADAQRDAAALREQFSALGVEAIPLMDGGLYDNQGLEALMEAASRILPDGETAKVDSAIESGRKLWKTGTDTQRFPGEFDLLFQRIATGDIPSEPPGLVIVSDAVRVDDPLLRAAFAPGDKRPLATLAQPAADRATLATAYRFWWLLVVLCGGTFLSVLYHVSVEYWSQGDFRPTIHGLLLYIIPMLLAGAAFIALLRLRGAARGALAAVDTILGTEGKCVDEVRETPKTWNLLRRLPLSQLGWLMKIRMASIMATVSDIFFVRHRILGYALLYGFPGWRRQLLSAEIFSLLIKAPEDAPQVTDAQRAVVKIASEQPTAFWYDTPDELAQLVATGQMSMCRNMIVFLQRRRAENPSAFSRELAEMLVKTQADWRLLRERPMGLVPQAARAAPVSTVTPKHG
ncbi:MAG TPA: patatin-like phospholipase family protein [Gemmatimonadaceae bacterium]|nr:patatin-like phospholipase family protein [Gemmatimonadaceae bacterium]